jgi:hypothetical protein
MRTPVVLVIVLIVAASACKKSTTPGGGGTTPVDNGPLGGTYSFSSCNAKTNDTTVEPGTSPGVMNQVVKERIYASQSCSGKLIITKTNMKSEGQVWNYGVSGTEKTTNLSTNITTVGTYLPYSDSRGISTTTYNSDYSFSIAGSQVQINDAQYLFCPAFLLLPAEKKYNYTFSGNQLTITVEYYSAANRSRSVTTSVFTKN